MTQTNTSPDLWLTDASWLQPGDVICQQFGADLSPVERIEWLDANRARLHHIDGTTGRVRVSTGHLRIRPRQIAGE